MKIYVNSHLPDLMELNFYGLKNIQHVIYNLNNLHNPIFYGEKRGRLQN